MTTNYRTERNTITLGTLIDWILFLTISVFVAYTVWYQYAREEIGGLITIAGVVMLLFSMLKLLCNNVKTLSPLLLLFVFVGYSALTGLVFAKHQNTFNAMLLQIIKYQIPMVAIIAYVGYNKERLRNILILFLIATTALSISSFVHGIMTVTKAITVGEYNTNTLSCNLILGSFVLLLLTQEYKSKLIRTIITGCIIVEFIAQIFAASRRGVIIHILMLLLFAVSVIKIKNDKNKWWKWIAAIIVLVIVLYFVVSNYGEQIDSLVVIQRFLGTAGTERGDYLRKTYQASALKLFIESPIIGVGLGGVMGEIGVYSHSLFYELLACSGIIGITLMMGQFLKYIRCFYKNYKKGTSLNNAELTENLMSMWFCVCILLSGIAVVFIYDVFYYYTFSILTALINVTQGTILRAEGKN